MSQSIGVLMCYVVAALVAAFGLRLVLLEPGLGTLGALAFTLVLSWWFVAVGNEIRPR